MSFFPTPIAGSDDQVDYATEATRIDLEVLDRYELQKVADGFRFVIVLYKEKISTLVKRLREREEELETVREENITLRRRVSELEMPEYVPEQIRVQEWIRGRELDYEQKRVDIENSRILAQGQAASGLGEVLKDNKYAPYAVSSFLDSTAKANKEKPHTLAKALASDLARRISVAESKGFVWKTRGAKMPSRPLTCEKLLGRWEEEYAAVENIPITDLLDARALAKMGDGAMCAAINRLAPDLRLDTRNVYNRLQAAIKAYVKSEGVKEPVETSDSYIQVAERLCAEVYGPGIDESERAEVVGVWAERISRHRGLKSTPVPLIRRTCHLGRLPTFFKWNPDHSSPGSRLMALKKGEYDRFYAELLAKISVESTGRRTEQITGT